MPQNSRAADIGSLPKQHWLLLLGPRWYLGLLALLLVIAAVISALFIFRIPKPLLAATYNWLQTSWAGGASETTAAHPTNQNGWTYYSAKDSGITAGTELTLATSPVAKTQTNDTHFSAGTHSSTVTSGSGDSAGVVLDATSDIVPTWSSSSSNTPYALNLPSTVSSAAIYISGSYAYTGRGEYAYSLNNSTTNLTTFSIADPAAPSRVHVLDTGVRTDYITGYGNYLYVGVSSGTIKIVDISTPTTPSVAATFDPSNSIANLAVSGSNLIVGGDGSIKIFSLANPLSPSLIGTYSTDPSLGSMTYFTVNGNYVYATFSGSDEYGEFGGLETVNISNPTAPSRSNSLLIEGGGLGGDIEVSGNYLYTCATNTGAGGFCLTAVAIYSIVNPAAPTYATSKSGLAPFHKMLIADGYLYLAGYSEAVSPGIHAYTLSNPTNPTLTSTYYDTGSRMVSFNLIRTGNTIFSVGQIYSVNPNYGLFTVPVTGYASSGTFTSTAVDTTQNSGYDTVDWTATTPANTTLTVKARTSNNSNMSGATDWASCPTLSDGGNFADNNCVTTGHRYVQYQAALGTSDQNATPTLSDITFNVLQYPASQTLTSSAFNSGDAANVVGGLQWTETLPTGADIKFQIRTAPDSTGAPGSWSSWLGPTDGTDYYTDPSGAETANATHSDGVDDQWVQYKVWLESDGTDTPTLSGATLVYVVNATPQFQDNPTAIQQSDTGLVSINYSVRDPDTLSGEPENRGYVTPSFEYSTNNGESWEPITTGLSASATDRKAVEESDYTTYSLTWNARQQISGTYSTTAKIRVTIDDGEGANNTATGVTSPLTIDAKAPVLGATPVLVNATTVPATLTLSATDDNTLEMKVGLVADLSTSQWEAYNAAGTVALATDPDTVYVQFRDSYGNSTAIQSVTTPTTPANPIVRDISNMDTNELQLFVSWRASTLAEQDFGSYEVWGKTDSGAYAKLKTTTDRAINYYVHSGLADGSTYYYKILVKDATGNVSGYSTEVNDSPNGQGGTDSTPPTISSVSIGSITTQSAVVTWDTDEVSDSTVSYSTSPATFTTSVGATTMANTASGIGQHSVTLTGLTPNTTYYVQVASDDPLNNQDTDNNGGDGYTFTTLSGAVITGVTTSEIQNTQATVVWQTDTAASSKVVYSTNANLSGSTQVTLDESVTNHSVTVTGLSIGTKYYFYVESGVASDNNGGDYYSFTTTQDTAAPVISSVDADPIFDTSAVINWTTNEKATSKVSFGTASETYSSSTSDLGLNTSHTVLVQSLTPNTKYYYVVSSTDASGNTATSTESDFTTLKKLSTEAEVTARETSARLTGRQEASGGGGGSGRDSTAPSVINTKLAMRADGTAEVTWDTNEIANSFVQFGPTSDYGEIHGNWEYATKHRVILDNLKPGTVYHYRLISADESGNITKAPDLTFNTSGAPVAPEEQATAEEVANISNTQEAESLVMAAVTRATQLLSKLASNMSINVLENTLSMQQDVIEQLSKAVPIPLLSGEPRVDVAATSATISWATDKESNSLVAYAPADAYAAMNEEPYQQLVGDPDASTTRHTVILAGLQPDTVYHYQIRSRTPVSSTAKSSDFVFRTLKKSIEITSYAVENKNDQTAIFRWTTNVESDSMVRYIPYRNNLRAVDEAKTVISDNFTTIHQIELKDLEGGSIYQIELISKDLTGTTATETIDPFSTNLENVPPTISQIQTESAISPGKETKIQTIISWATNEASTSQVYYQKGISTDSSTLAESTAVDTNYTRKHVVILTNFEPGTVYQFRVESVDSSGQKAISNIHTLLTPRQRESVFQVIMSNVEDSFGWLRRLR